MLLVKMRFNTEDYVSLLLHCPYAAAEKHISSFFFLLLLSALPRKIILSGRRSFTLRVVETPQLKNRLTDISERIKQCVFISNEEHSLLTRETELF